MKKSVSFILAILLCALLVSCISIPVGLVGIQTEGTNIQFDRGNTILSGSTANLSYSFAGGIIDFSEGRILLSIKNKTNSPILFNDTSVQIYNGDAYTNTWALSAIWSAESYYARKAKAQSNAEFWTAFIGTLETIDIAINGTGEYNYYSSPRGTFVEETRYYDASDVVLAAMITDMATEYVREEGRSFLDYLKTSLLYRSTIKPGQEYAGWIFFPVSDNRYPDYLIVVTDPVSGEKMNFLFSREDSYRFGL